MNLFQKAWSGLVGRFVQLGFPNREGHRSYAGVPVNETSVLALSAAWACTNLLAGAVASLPLKLYVPDGRGGRKEINDHPLYSLLHDSPNADQDAFMFWEGGQARLELHGNMMAEKVFSGDRLVALNPILDGTASRASDGEIWYTWTENGQSRREPSSRVFHVRGFGGSPLGGLSTLAYGAQVFGLASATNIAAQRTFANGLRPSGVISVDKWVTAPQRDQLESALAEKYTGAMNAGRPFLLEGGMTWSDVNITPEDAQMLQSRGYGVEETCRFFGVPPFMIGHNDKASGYPASLEQQLLLFSKFHFAKRPRRIEMASRKQLLTPRDRALGVTVSADLDEMLRGDSAGRATFYDTMTRIGAMTINQVRGREGWGPIEGGDIPRIQSQNVPISEAVPARPVAPR
jgi:HK97 family phage portal protein